MTSRVPPAALWTSVRDTDQFCRRFRAFERTCVTGGHHSVAGLFRRSSVTPVADNGVQSYAGTHDQVVDCRNDRAARRERVQAGARSEMVFDGQCRVVAHQDITQTLLYRRRHVQEQTAHVPEQPAR